MQTTQSVEARFSGGELAVGIRPLALVVAGVLVALVGCGPSLEAAEAPGVASRTQRIVAFEEVEAQVEDPTGISVNGISVNGISVNGISVNGISVNGISVNGLTPEAVKTPQFDEWFKSAPEQNEVFMRYVVRCGLAAQKSITYTHPELGQVYTWKGLLGLTPKWGKGEVLGETEMQLMTACLAAHANKYGLHISISVLGNDSQGQKIHYSATELAQYSRREGCFFGNLDQSVIYVGSDWNHLNATESTARACGLTSSPGGVSSECPPFIHIGTCSSVCTLDRTGLYYESCTVDGKSYRPITTRLQPKDVYQCGDGVCQFTESCGTSTTWDSCQADCGTCVTEN